MAVWDLYRQKGLLPDNVEIKLAENPTPVLDAYQEFEAHPENKYLAVFGKDEEDRWRSVEKNKEKYGHVTPVNIGNLKGLSASGLRTAIKNKDLQAIETFLPKGVTAKEYIQALSKGKKEDLTEAYKNKKVNTRVILDTPKFNYEKTLEENLQITVNEIALNPDNAAEIYGDITSGKFQVGKITYHYEIKQVKNPYEDEGSFFNIMFHPEGNVTSQPLGGKEDYIKILNTMYKVILDFIQEAEPDYIGIASMDNDGSKNYHRVYANLTDNRSNKIPGYFRKDVSLTFDTPNGPGRFVILKKKEDLTETYKGKRTDNGAPGTFKA
jgi:hypothetical protein